MAGIDKERQETGLCQAILKAVKQNQNNPVTVIAGKKTIKGVIGAIKYKGNSSLGTEPYTDVILQLYNGTTYNISCKGTHAPSLAGGGAKGLETISKGITKKFMVEAHKALIAKGLSIGDKVPDVYCEIPKYLKDKVVIGTVDMGGPIDYMYIGPMTVSANYNKNTNVLKLSGEFIPSLEYSKSQKLYIRSRTRFVDQRFDPDAVDKNGTPKLYGKSPSTGKTTGRLVVTNETSTKGVFIKITNG